MKILILSEFFPTGNDLKFSGGVEARNFYVAKYLAKKHQVTILTSRIKGTVEEEKIYGFNIVRVGKITDYKATTGGFMSRTYFLYQAIKKGRTIKADVVEGTNFLTHLIAYKIAKKNNVPVIAWYPDVWIGKWIEAVGFSGLVGEILERINLRLKFDAFIAISNQTKNKLLKYTNSKIYVVPCGVDPKEYPQVVKKEPTVICIARLAKYKNIKELILAFALLHKKNKNLKLKIVGRGPEEKTLKDLAANLLLQKSVLFLSNFKRRDLIALLSRAKVFCLPSQTEGFGISVIESAACGVPYVISDIPVFKEITKNYAGGLSFKLHDINDLAKKMSSLLYDPASYSKKSREAKLLASNYSWESIAAQTETIYTSLLK